MSVVCEYCNTSICNSQSLKRHQTSTKYCIEMQGKTKEVTIYKCICDKEFNRSDNYKRHTKKCKMNIKLKEKDNQLKLKDEEFKSKDGELKELLKVLTSTLKQLVIQKSSNIFNDLIPLDISYIQE